MTAIESGSEELAAIVRGTTDAIIGKTTDGVITSWNAGAERLYGYAAEEIVGKSIDLIIPVERLHEEHAILAQVQEGRIVDPYLTQRVHRDGSRVDISLTVGPIRDADGTIVRDMTALQSREAQLSALIEAAPDAFIVVDGTGTIQFVNLQTETLFGYPRAELIGQHMEVLVPDRVRSKHPGLRGAYAQEPTARPMRGRNLL